MNFFSGLLSMVKNFIFPQVSVQKVFDVSPAISKNMEDNLSLWYAMYINQPPWAKDPVVPMGLPSAICREIARPALAELEISITGSQRAEYLQDQINRASHNFLKQLEIGLAVGGVAFRPYFRGNQIYVDATCATGFSPTKFDPDGACTGGVFREKRKVKDSYYIRLEYHDFSDGTETIKNKAVRSDSSWTVRDEVPLGTVQEWEALPAEAVVENLESPLFSYFKPPQANNLETDSPAGVSVYGGATVDLIRRADEQWDLLRWEFKSSQRKIFMDGTESRANDFDKRLFEIGFFRPDGSFFEKFDPAIRDEPIYRGLQDILRQIEFNVGVSYGTISDPQTIEKTATEVRNSKWRMFVTIDSVQKSLERTISDLVYAMDVYADLYHLAPSGDYEISYSWGDSVLEDAEAKEKERANDRQDLASGILNPWEYRAKWYNEDEATAKASLPKAHDLTTEEQDDVE